MIKALALTVMHCAGVSASLIGAGESLEVRSDIRTDAGGKAVLHLEISNRSRTGVMYSEGDLPWIAHPNMDLKVVAISSEFREVTPRLGIEDPPRFPLKELAAGETLAGDLSLERRYPGISSAKVEHVFACWKFDLSRAFPNEAGVAQACEVVNDPNRTE